jgi:threonylcarbamoyladenosine tRNA methylthiotransferase MtaB
MRVAFCTLGCKLNQAETESLAAQFGQSGFELLSPDDAADVYVINTCTVTHIADGKSRHWLRLARRRNPQALVIATGCYAQRSRQELAPFADVVVDNIEKEHLLQIVQGLLRPTPPSTPRKTTVCHYDQALSAMSAPETVCPITSSLRTRSLIKIQDGCRGPCAYCIVPKVRPREYSLPASQIIDEVKQKGTLGYREVVLTGTKVGSYKDDSTDLRDLVQRILSDTGIERLRLSSLQPLEISSEFLALWQDARLCAHFHLALQSGSESVLKRMRRSYSLDQYRRTVDLIREKIADAAVTTDIIVGFPGESDEEFKHSYSFCQQARFANIHVFPFSPRPETAAARMPDQIEEKTKQERNRRMLDLSRSCRRLFGEQFLGQTMPVLWEQEIRPGTGIYSGLTGNYIRVFAQSEKPLNNEIRPARLVEFHGHAIWGDSR